MVYEVEIKFKISNNDINNNDMILIMINSCLTEFPKFSFDFFLFAPIG